MSANTFQNPVSFLALHPRKSQTEILTLSHWLKRPTWCYSSQYACAKRTASLGASLLNNLHAWRAVEKYNGQLKELMVALGKKRNEFWHFWSVRSQEKLCSVVWCKESDWFSRILKKSEDHYSRHWKACCL